MIPEAKELFRRGGNFILQEFRLLFLPKPI